MQINFDGNLSSIHCQGIYNIVIGYRGIPQYYQNDLELPYIIEDIGWTYKTTVRCLSICLKRCGVGE